MTEQVTELEELRVRHQEAMAESSSYQEVLEKKIYETNQKSLELLQQIRDQ